MPSQMISVKVQGGETFCIHKDVLIEQSDYFAKALDGPFSEGQTDSIDLDDIPASDFGLYVSVMYASALNRADLALQDLWPLDADDGLVRHGWPLILLLWQLGDRFLNQDVISIAEGELHAKVCVYSVRNWQKMYERRSEATLKARMIRLQDAYRLCRDNGQPFERTFIEAASNAPPQVIAECVDDLEDDVFRSEVTKAFALRFADPASTDRKRRRDERMGEGQQRKKPKTENLVSPALLEVLRQSHSFFFWCCQGSQISLAHEFMALARMVIANIVSMQCCARPKGKQPLGLLCVLGAVVRSRCSPSLNRHC